MDKRAKFLKTLDELSPAQAKYAAVKLFDEVARLSARAHEPIAVVGMGCRFPGGCDTPESFWQALVAGRDCVGEARAERFPAEQLRAEGRIASTRAGLIDGIDLFDPDAFGIAPRELEWMDPQHRVLLEVAWEALEHAGIAPFGCAGSPIGIFVGIATHDYELLQARNVTFEEAEAHCGTGLAPSIAAGRIAYTFGFEGPTVAVDTACSSSLVAVHLAVESLRRGECDAALAGGVNLLLYPFNSCIFSRAGMLSPDGVCRTFDDAANGYVRAEGCGLVVLKRWSDAVQSRDRIVAVIRGSAINHDGRTQGLTAPNALAQERVIRSALRNANCEPADIQHVEAHGTGTSLGDPIELSALAKVYGAQRRGAEKLWVSSLKTNAGHMEAAAGIGGLIKQALSLECGTIPPHLHWHKLNRHAEPVSRNVEIPVAATPWPQSAHARMGAVSSFGFSGTNAHVILEAPAPRAARQARASDPLLLKLSAKSSAALAALAARYAARLAELSEEDAADFCYSVNVGRSDFALRTALCGGRAALIEQLEALSRTTSSIRAGPPSAQSTAIEFLFSRRSDAGETVRAALLDELRDAAAETRLGLSASEHAAAVAVLESRDDGARAHAAAERTFVEDFVAARLFAAWGVVPASALGHGTGEFVATACTGSMSFDSALTLLRTRLCDGAATLGECLQATQAVAPSCRLVFDRAPADSAHSDAIYAYGCQGEHGFATQAIARLYASGAPIKWSQYYARHGGEKIPVPTYPFQRRGYWLPGMCRGQIRKDGDGARVDVRCYRIAWEAYAAETPEDGTLAAEEALIVYDDTGAALGTAMAVRAGCPTIMLSADQGGREAALCVEHRLAEYPSVRRVVLLASADDSHADAGSRSEACIRSCDRLLSIARSLVSADVRRHLTVVTRGAAAVLRDAEPCPTGAALTAACRVIANELPDLRCTAIDIAPDESDRARTAERLWSLLDSDCGEVALRGQLVYRPRLVEHELDRGEVPIRAARTYLVLGGAGGIGLHVAKWLLDAGAQDVTLASRTVAPATAERLQESCRATGASVAVERVDVTEWQQLAAAVARIAARAPLGGIIHAAGVLDDALVTAHDATRLRRVCLPKMLGALHALALAERYRPEFCVTFSSLSVALGTAGQACYAAANAFMDALAIGAQPRGLPFATVAWGPWSDTGMTVGRSAHRHAEQFVQSLSPERALAWLSALLAQRGHVICAALNAAPVSATDSQQQLLSRLCGRTAPLAKADAQPHAAPLRAALERQPDASRRRATAAQYLRELIARTLRLRPDAHALRGDVPLKELGLDSMLALELRNAIVAATGRDHAVGLLYEHPTLDDLTDYVIGTSTSTPAASRVSQTVAADDVAVVGMACRFPGAVRSPQEFWSLLAGARSGIESLSNLRWSEDEYYSSERGAKGRMYVNRGGVVQDIELFDYAFFGISKHEAEVMDPHQKLLLEVSWEALERAGVLPRRLRGSLTGFFVGMMASDFSHLIVENCDPEDANPYMATGSSLSVAAGRLAYFYCTHGPSVVLDTACSSSLVAIHQACQSLRLRESDLALAGGVNLILAPGGNIMLCSAQMLAPDGECKAFDAAANGYVRSEGCGLVVLKRLRDAVADGDVIHAVIKGSAVNQAGRTQGLTAPNGPSQEAVIRRALQAASVDASAVEYVEAHGTGTALGDPIEIEALRNAYCAGRRSERPLYVGAVKTNIGHCEAAAGVAGLMKTVLALEHAAVPPNLNLRQVNPHLCLDDSTPIRFPMQLQPWPAAARTAAVSSFGFSGSNAHAILQSFARAHAATQTDLAGVHLCKVSGETPAAVRRLARAYAGLFAGIAEQQLADACYSINRRRGDYRHGCVVAGRSTRELAAACAALGLTSGATLPDRRALNLVISFADFDTTGQACGRELYEASQSFRRRLDCAGELFREQSGGALPDQLWGAQPKDSLALAARLLLSVCLAEHCMQAGIEPAAVHGSGVGELAAACIAGMVNMAEVLQLGIAIARQPRSISPPASMPDVQWRAPKIPLVSIEPCSPGMAEPGLLSKLARSTPALRAVLPTRTRAQSGVMIEIGAQGLTAHESRDTAAECHPRPDLIGLDGLLQTLDACYAHGGTPRWDRLYPAGNLIDVPTYPFEPSACGELLFYGRRPQGTGEADRSDDAMLEEHWIAHSRTWRELAAAAGSQADARAIVFCERDELGDIGSVPSLIGVAEGEQLERLSGNCYSAPVRSVADVEALLAALGDAWRGAARVFARRGPADISHLSYETAARHILHTPLRIMQQLAGAPAERSAAALYVVTRGAQQVDPSETVDPWQSALSAMARVFGLEHSGRLGALVDLPASSAQPLSEQLRTILGNAVPMREYCVRGDVVFERRLMHAAKAKGPPVRLRGDAAYLIIGGLGGLGLCCAERFIDLGAQHLVLTSQSGVPRSAADETRLAALRSRATIETRALNVAAAYGMRTLFDELSQAPRPLRGVVHCAGVNKIAPIASLEPAAFMEVLAAKACGTSLVLELSCDLPLDFLICYSSIAGVWGSAGMGAYSAANRFVDAAAANARRQGKPVSAICWGPWAQVGMAAHSETAARQAGLIPLDPREGMSMLERVLAAPSANHIVVRLDVRRFTELYSMRLDSALFSALVAAAPGKPAGTATRPPLVGEIERAARHDRIYVIEETVAALVRQALNLEAYTELSVHDSLHDLGINSLQALEIRNALNQRAGLSLPGTLLFDCPTIRDVSALVLEKLENA